ncbi:ATP-dependent RNA helicase DDX39, partial [Caligus rogercresseyi]
MTEVEADLLDYEEEDTPTPAVTTESNGSEHKKEVKALMSPFTALASGIPPQARDPSCHRGLWIEHPSE